MVGLITHKSFVAAPTSAVVGTVGTALGAIVALEGLGVPVLFLRAILDAGGVP